MRWRVALVVLAVAMVGCGGGAGEPDTSLGPDSAPATNAVSPPPTTGAVRAEPSSPTTAAPITPPDSTTQPTIPPSTGVVEPNLAGAITLGPPDPALLAASPPSEIDWAAVGPGWLLIDHPMGWLVPTDPPTLDRRGIYLVAPDDTVHGVSALPNDGSWPSDVSSNGRQVLLQQFDDACAEGCECPADMAVEAQAYGYALLDLPTTSLRSVIDPVSLSVCGANPFSREVGFTTDGTGIWVAETWYNGDYHATRVRLSRVDIATGAWTELLAESVEVDETEPHSSTEISVVELDDGRIVVGTPTGSWVRGADGSPLRELDVPRAGCVLQRIWDVDHVLARCPASASEFPLPPDVPVDQCPASGLWLVARDGASAQLLAVPLNNGYVYCWSGYSSAEQLGDELAVGVGGDGCSDDVVLIAVDGTVTRWLPDFADSCTESLLGVRGAAWLISASPEDGATVVYEVTPQSSTRIELPPGWITVIASTGR